MKQLFAFLLSTNAFSLFAAVLTVSNDPALPAQFNDLQAAIDAASEGDTLYVAPTSNYYFDVTVTDKSLHFWGGGYLAPVHSWITRINLNGTIDTFSIRGIQLDLFYSETAAVSQVVFEECFLRFPSIGVSYLYNINDLTITNCLVAGVTRLLGTNSVLIRNNIFCSGATNPSLWDHSTGTMTVSHNLFCNSTGAGGKALGIIQNAVVENNIFYSSGIQPGSTDVANCAFTNNLFYGCSGPDQGLNAVTNEMSDDPLFENLPIVVDLEAIASYDPHCQAGSPATNAGTDGTTLGPYGGVQPLPVALNGTIELPVVTGVVISNAVVGQGGNLNVTITGHKGN